MPKSFEDELKGTRAVAAAAVDDIERELKGYGKSGHKDARKYQLKYGYLVLRSICLASNTRSGIHYDIYCDIIERVLAPNLHPTASASCWGSILENVRYLHHLLLTKKLYAEAGRTCKWLYDCADKLQTETDYKHILGIYCLQLMAQRAQLQLNIAGVQQETARTLRALTKLFTDMLHCHKESNFNYNELMCTFLECYCKQSTSVLNFLANFLPFEERTQMYEAFFALLKGLEMPAMGADALELYCQQQLQAFTYFCQLDVQCKSQQQQQLAPQHLRTCCELRALQADKGMHYTFQLLYYYVKCVCSQSKYSNYAGAYVELCGKFNNFLEKSSEALLKYKWFLDALVSFVLLLTQTHQRGANCFDVSWQQMNSINAYVAHFELLQNCIRLAPRITASKLAPWSCCNSVRKHVILSLAQSALGAYTQLVLNEQISEESGEFINLQKVLTSIVRHAVNVIGTMSCIADVSADCTAISNELKMFYVTFAQFTRDIKTSAQARFCIDLAATLEKLRSKFLHTDWTMLLRRLYKAAECSDDAALIAELHSLYIAALLPDAIHSESVRNQLAIYYTRNIDKSVLAWHTDSQYPLKTPLSTSLQRQLHWLEVQQFGKYAKASEQLQRSLFSHCATPYEHVLVLRATKVPLPQLLNELEHICVPLQGKKARTRLEHLTWAHARTQALHTTRDVKKKEPEFETKDCMEDKIEELLQRKECCGINIRDEFECVNMALAALHAFAAFYDTADAAPISSDEAVIDWELIVNDVASLALLFQLTGYLQFAAEAWALHYRIADCIADAHNALRALSFYCEHVDELASFPAHAIIDVEREVQRQTPVIVQTAEQLDKLSARKQTALLLCLCQLCYYYSYRGQFGYAQLLYELVRHKRATLSERQGKYDIVRSTMEAVRMRILWKHSSHLWRKQRQQRGSVDVSVQLLRGCILRDIEQTLENFRDFVYISSSDTLPFMLLLLNFAQQTAECTANRLYDYHINSLFASVMKIALHSGLALRVVQILSMWMWSNLQMEYVDKAQTKLRLIECVLGVRSMQDLATQKNVENKRAVLGKSQTLTEPITELRSLQLQAVGVETMRKVVPSQFSPIRVQKPELINSDPKSSDLQRFFNRPNTEALRKSDLLQWHYFVVGCLAARLYFLIDDYEGQDQFYEESQHWLEERRDTLHHNHFRNFRLLCMQHYANYLRARKQYDKALSILETALDECDRQQHKVDTMYRLNLLLQLRGTERELAQKESRQNKERLRQSQLRKALEFSVSLNGSDGATFDAAQHVAATVKKKKCSRKAAASKLYATTTKKIRPVGKVSSAAGVAAFTIYNSDDEAEGKLPRKQLFGKQCNGGNGSQSSQEDIKTGGGDSGNNNKNKQSVEDDLNLCHAIELIDLNDTVEEQEKDEKRTATTTRKTTKSTSNTNDKVYEHKQVDKVVEIKTTKSTLTSCKTSTQLKSMSTVDKSAAKTKSRNLPTKRIQSNSKTATPTVAAKPSVAEILASVNKRAARRKAPSSSQLISELITLDDTLEEQNHEVASIKHVGLLRKADTVTPIVSNAMHTRRPTLQRQACVLGSSGENDSLPSPTLAVEHITECATTSSRSNKLQSSRKQSAAAVDVVAAATLTRTTSAAVTVTRTRVRQRKATIVSSATNNENLPAVANVMIGSGSVGAATRRRLQR